jgi:hypothetical protein
MFENKVPHDVISILSALENKDQFSTDSKLGKWQLE